MSIYHDGLAPSSLIASSSSHIPGDGRIVIGRRFSELDSNYASVQVDELLFFNQALTFTEINALSDVD